MADSVAEQIAALQDDDWAIREEAAVALGAFRDPRAVGRSLLVIRFSDASSSKLTHASWRIGSL